MSKSKAVLVASTPKASSPVTTSRSKRGKKITCHLCISSIDSPEDLLKCKDCQQHMHRYFAGVTKTYHAELSNSSTPFKCWPCSQKFYQDSSISHLKETIEDHKLQVAHLQNDLKVLTGRHLECPCQPTVSTIQNEVKMLSDKCDSYAKVVNKNIGKPGGKNSRKRVKAVTKDPNNTRVEHMNRAPKVTVPGSRKIWRTKRTEVTTIMSTVATISSIKEHVSEITVKRKFKTTSHKRKSKWWFVIRGDESIMKLLDDNWKSIKDQTSWLLEPVLRFDDAPGNDSSSVALPDTPTRVQDSQHTTLTDQDEAGSTNLATTTTTTTSNTQVSCIDNVPFLPKV